MMKKCPNCTSLMPLDTTRCLRCGFDSPARMSAASGGGALVPPAAAPVAKGRLRTGWALARESLRVLRADKQLLLFPLLSGIASILVIASFAGAFFASGLAGEKEPLNDLGAWALAFGFYFVNYFVIVFFNAALVACAMKRFGGGTPSLASGLRKARRRLGKIVAWALFAASVGVILRFIAERVGFVGRIVIALLGAAWTVATYFVVPVLVVEKLGPLDAARRSATIVKKAWGESLVSHTGIGLVTFLMSILVIVPLAIAALMLAAQTQSIAVLIAGLGAVLVVIVLAALIGSALNSIALCALYLYATEGKVPQAFANTGLQYAFATKQKKK
jgi:uncharacterized protein DUF6159